MNNRTPRVRTESLNGGFTGGPLSGKLASLLLAYHVLIVLGALVTVTGISSPSSPFVALGLALIGTGITVEIGVLIWTAQPIRVASRMAHASLEKQPPDTAPTPRFCAGCGWSGDRTLWICPRCGRVTVSLGKPAVPR